MGYSNSNPTQVACALFNILAVLQEFVDAVQISSNHCPAPGVFQATILTERRLRFSLPLRIPMNPDPSRPWGSSLCPQHRSFFLQNVNIIQVQQAEYLWIPRQELSSCPLSSQLRYPFSAAMSAALKPKTQTVWWVLYGSLIRDDPIISGLQSPRLPSPHRCFPPNIALCWPIHLKTILNPSLARETWRDKNIMFITMKTPSVFFTSLTFFTENALLLDSLYTLLHRWTKYHQIIILIDQLFHESIHCM